MSHVLEVLQAASARTALGYEVIHLIAKWSIKKVSTCCMLFMASRAQTGIGRVHSHAHVSSLAGHGGKDGASDRDVALRASWMHLLLRNALASFSCQCNDAMPGMKIGSRIALHGSAALELRLMRLRLHDSVCLAGLGTNAMSHMNSPFLRVL